MSLPLTVCSKSRIRRGPNTKSSRDPAGGSRICTNVRRMRPVPGSPAPVHATRQSSCAYRRLTNTDIPARWPAGGSSAQCFHHHAQQRGIYLSANAQPLPTHKHQLQPRFRCVLTRRPCLHQREPRRLLSPEPFAPNVERLLGDALFLAKLLHRHSAALLLGDTLPPIRTSLLDRLTRAASCHVTTMRPPSRLWKRGSRAVYLAVRPDVLHRIQF